MARALAGGVALGWVCATGAVSAATLEVPAQHATIQAAVDAAADGDTVRIAPGVYTENVSVAGKSVVLSSHFEPGGDPALIDQTVVDGGGGTFVVHVTASAGPQTRISGLTLRNADDGITADAPFEILHSRITGTSDGIDYEDGSGGLVRDSTFEGNSDDGIDLDNAVAVVIEDSRIRNNGNDGIEIRLQAYTGPELEIVIRGNEISGNEADGIQLIDYESLTDRVFHIERNLIVGNLQAGIGMMCCERTAEDFEGADLPERVRVIHNTFVGNDHGMTGGHNVITLNNIFAGTTNIALKRAHASSIAAYNLFYANGTDHSESNVDLGTTLFADPQLDAQQRPAPGSPAIDAGTGHFEHNSEVVWDADPASWQGAAPDLGAWESRVTVPALALPGATLLGLGLLAAARRRFQRRRPLTDESHGGPGREPACVSHATGCGGTTARPCRTGAAPTRAPASRRSTPSRTSLPAPTPPAPSTGC